MVGFSVVLAAFQQSCWLSLQVQSIKRIAVLLAADTGFDDFVFVGLVLQTASDVLQQLPFMPLNFLSRFDLFSIDVDADAGANH